MTTQSAELTEFYQVYQDWLNKGAPQFQPFCRSDGLCINMYYKWKERETHGSLFPIKNEMKRQFLDANLSSTYPFHKDENHYNYEANQDIQHLNPLRNQWIADHLGNS